MEKTILRILASCAFSHSLHPTSLFEGVVLNVAKGATCDSLAGRPERPLFFGEATFAGASGSDADAPDARRCDIQDPGQCRRGRVWLREARVWETLQRNLGE
jgi:hypothetical protein